MIDYTLLRKLCAADGISGDEGEVRDLIINEIKDCADEIRIDNLGNILVHKKGRDRAENKLMLSFCGGGVSFSEFTAARPNRMGTKEKQVYYALEAEPADLLLRTGTNGRSKKNPFRDWTVVVLPYTTGDFHCGQNDFPYTDLNGKSAVLHHHAPADLGCPLQI